jgi:hypothetical protein
VFGPTRLCEADELPREDCSPGTRSAILNALAGVEEADGNLDRATALREEALALVPAGSPDYLPMLSSTARAASSGGHRARSVELADQGLALAQNLNDRRERLTFLTLLGMALLP